MTDAPPENPPASARRWLWIGLSVLVLGAVIALLFQTEDVAEVTQTEMQSPAQLVSVVVVERAVAQATVSVFAELRPLWDADIRASVSGRIVTVHDTALAGVRVEAGAPLFAIERTQYVTAVAASELSLDEAKLALLRAEINVTLARGQFDRDGITPPNDFALHLPEHRIAERLVTSAQAQLDAAQQQLADTDVTAPFSGFVTERLASLGQTVSTGEALLHLSDDSRFELVAELSQTDWALLNHPIAGGTAQLFHRDGRPLGAAHIRQGGGFLDPQTRQMRVFLEVAGTNDAVLAGDFLRVSFSGREIPDTLTLPETALTRAGHIWLVDDDDLLERRTPVILFRAGDTITIAAPEGAGHWRFAITPLASFLPGQRVTAQQAED